MKVKIRMPRAGEWIRVDPDRDNRLEVALVQDADGGQDWTLWISGEWPWAGHGWPMLVASH